MSQVQHNYEMEDAFRKCPVCDFDAGFNNAFERIEGSEEIRWMLVCPECQSVFDIGLRATLKK